MEQEIQNEIVIYQAENGKTQIDVKLQNDTVWLTQDMIVKLFDSSKANISEHITHIFEEQELEKDSTVRKFRTVRKEGKRSISRELEYYNLDMVIAVGYRVNSKTATKFRIWATNILKNYLVQGYSINEKVLQNQKSKIIALQTSIDLLSRSLSNQIESVDEAKNVAAILGKFSKGLDLLDSFDHKTLDSTGSTKKEAIKIPREEFLKVIDEMKSEFSSDVFANPKDDSFDSSINQIYQTFGGEDCYPTIEEKAAMLLYLITKNHSFSDGNKRIAASCFLYFLDKNGILYKNNVPIIDNATLFSLTVLIAESNPSEMETMKQIVVSVLN